MKKIGIFTPTNLKTNIVVDQIVTLHYFHYTKNFTFSGEKHDFWEIAYIDKGQVGVVAENQGYDLRQGEAIFHKPNEYHNIWTKNQYANAVILSFVSHSPAMSFFENKIIEFNEEHQIILAKILKEGEGIFLDPLSNVYQTKLNPAKNGPFGGLQIIKNYIELLLLYIIREQTIVNRKKRISSSIKSQGDNQIVDAIKQMLSDNIYGNISLKQVLHTVCFSKSYITQLFRLHTGQSIMDYYIEMKMKEAQKLISERDLSFTEIAEKLNFNSIHHFSGSFKKRIGMTPTEYKKSVQSMEVL